MSKWSNDAIALEIRYRYESGLDLSYSGVLRENLSLLRAATRYIGSWQKAVEYAGLDYESVRRYKLWTNERIILRIQELYAQDTDLSWRHVAEKIDPMLAAAATKKNHFGSWRTALEAAGLDYDTIRRYRAWSDDEVIRQVRDLHAQGAPLNAKQMEKQDVSLLTAARRRFVAWDKTLSAAGLDTKTIVQRTVSYPARREPIPLAATACQ